MTSRVPHLVMAVSSVLLAQLAGAQGYVWEEIVIPGARVSAAFGLNDKGQTAVTTTDGRAGIYGNGTFTQLPPGPAGFQLAATGINNEGVITGPAFSVAGGSEQGYILRGSTYTLFYRPGWDYTEPRAIADTGLITGYSSNPLSGTYAGFVYDPDTDSFTDVTPPGSTFTIAQGMNKFGRITGHGREINLTIGRYAFVWQQQTITKGKRELQPFLVRLKVGEGQSSARGINDSGLVVGFTTNLDGITGDGFVGSDALGYQRLVAPGGEMPGNSTICQGINSLAQVVCVVADSSGQALGAFIGSPSKGDGATD